MISELDARSIASISFVPTHAELDQLVQHSKSIPKERGPLLSKLHMVPAGAGLVPESLDPNDTILATLGRKFGKIGDPKVMTVIDDRNMPLGGKSCGPNGVLTDCQVRYGQDRINLFYHTKAQTVKLLVDYINMRDSNLSAIFEMYVNKLLKHRDNGYLIDPSKKDQLSEKLRPHYSNVCDMFAMVRDSELSLKQCGISCVSFCQTWLRNGHPVGDAQFSVMSPHFQTRFYIEDDKKLLNVPNITPDMLESYGEMINVFTEELQKDYGVKGGGQAFINLDGLLQEISPLRQQQELE